MNPLTKNWHSGFYSLLALCCFALPQATASFIQWQVEDGGNGHYYGLVLPADPSEAYNWFQARDAAQSMSHLGATGYLVTITSFAEDQFLKNTFQDQIQPDKPAFIWGANAQAGDFLSFPNSRL
jgi:hypothetical protein